MTYNVFGVTLNLAQSQPRQLKVAGTLRFGVIATATSLHSLPTIRRATD